MIKITFLNTDKKIAQKKSHLTPSRKCKHYFHQKHLPRGSRGKIRSCTMRSIDKKPQIITMEDFKEYFDV